MGIKSGSIIIDSTKTAVNHDDLIELVASVTKTDKNLTESFVDNRVQSNIKIVGDWDATSGSYPLADESNVTFTYKWGTTIKQGGLGVLIWSSRNC